METTIQKVINKLTHSVENPRLYKTFKFSMEDLQDSPERILEVVNYLEMHKDKIEDYVIHTWTDSESFSPVIMIEVIPNEEFRKYMRNNADLIITSLSNTDGKK